MDGDERVVGEPIAGGDQDPAVTHDPHAGPERGLRRGRAEQHHDVGIDRVDLAPPPRRARARTSSAFGFWCRRTLPWRFHLKCFTAFVRYTCRRSIPAASSARSSTPPAGPTNGRPSRSSLSPGCSPISTRRAAGSPSPKTVWVACSYRSQRVHPRASVAQHGEARPHECHSAGAGIGPVGERPGDGDEVGRRRAPGPFRPVVLVVGLEVRRARPGAHVPVGPRLPRHGVPDVDQRLRDLGDHVVCAVLVAGDHDAADPVVRERAAVGRRSRRSARPCAPAPAGRCSTADPATSAWRSPGSRRVRSVSRMVGHSSPSPSSSVTPGVTS